MAHKVITVTNPGAGNEWVSPVPAGKYWVVRTGTYVFTTSVAAADRSPRIQIDDGTNPLFISDLPTVQAASLAYRYSLGPRVPSAGATAARVNGIPKIVLLPGYRIGSTTENIQAGDAYTSIRLYIDERDQEYGLPFTPWAE